MYYSFSILYFLNQLLILFQNCQEMHQTHQPIDNIDSSLNVLGDQSIVYNRRIGAYKPKFASIPDDYFPLTNLDVCLASLLLILVVCGVLGIMVGFIFWILANGTLEFVQTWSIILLFWVIIMLILTFLGGRTKIIKQREIIKEKIIQEHKFIDRASKELEKQHL